jgi:hypothetical protein
MSTAGDQRNKELTVSVRTLSECRRRTAAAGTQDLTTARQMFANEAVASRPMFSSAGTAVRRDLKIVTPEFGL